MKNIAILLVFDRYLVALACVSFKNCPIFNCAHVINKELTTATQFWEYARHWGICPIENLVLVYCLSAFGIIVRSKSHLGLSTY